MKRIFVALALLGVAASASAQNMYDAMMFSENNYYGTARSMALGNAMTAIGGDLGSIGINPAGSAVAGYSQITMTPGLSFSNMTSTYAQFGTDVQGPAELTGKTRFGLPNIGYVENFETGNSWGVKSFSFGLVSNRTANYNQRFMGFGTNPYTTRFGELAVAAGDYLPKELDYYDAYYESTAPWDVIAAYRANLISGYGKENNYAGSTEFVPNDGYPFVPGELKQVADVLSSGSKQDIVVNFGLNMDDKLFVGINVGIPTASYRYNEFYTETPTNPDMFPITFTPDGVEIETNFKGGSMEYERSNDIDGIYAKLGVIYLPTKNLRIGAAIQTPTAYTIKEMWQWSAGSTYGNSTFNSSELSPLGEYTYCLRSPYIANFGVAYTFGGRGFISADYELTDYSVMRFSELHEDFGDDYFYYTNECNRLFAGISHSLRLGLEYRLTPEFAVRAGYSVLTSPEKHYTDASGEDINASIFVDNFDDLRGQLRNASYYQDRTDAVSFGIGYSSPGSFFMDLAARRTNYPNSAFAPYYDYQNFDSTGKENNYPSPRLLNTRNVWDVVMTLGFRF